jgi:ADP-heptose:LPS heptosyltransferase
VGLVLSAGSPPSVWPVDRFADLATRLQREGIAPVVLRTFGDEASVARFESIASGVPRADAPEIRRFLGLLSALDLVVCANSGPAHFAMALGVPTVTLYGPTYARHWSPDLPIAGVVSSPRKHCAACARGAKRTAAEHTCMLEITVDAVHEQVRALLAATSRTKP